MIVTPPASCRWMNAVAAARTTSGIATTTAGAMRARRAYGQAGSSFPVVDAVILRRQRSGSAVVGATRSAVPVVAVIRSGCFVHPATAADEAVDDPRGWISGILSRSCAMLMTALRTGVSSWFASPRNRVSVSLSRLWRLPSWGTSNIVGRMSVRRFPPRYSAAALRAGVPASPVKTNRRSPPNRMSVMTLLLFLGFVPPASPNGISPGRTSRILRSTLAHAARAA